MFVSVIVPSYNHAQYLEERINSILNQTYTDFEVILLDDLSPDNTAEILAKYKTHPKVSHCIINEQNSGSTFYQWNKGIDLAKGELIWIAESDDTADPHFLEKLIPQFDQNQNLVLAYSQSYKMSAEGELTGTWKEQTDPINSEEFENSFTMSGLKYIEKYLIDQNTVPNASGVIFKKQTYIDVGRANPSLRFIGDWEIWLKIISQGEIYYCAECLNYFRYHNTSVIAQARHKKDHFEVRRQVLLFRNEIQVFLNLNTNTNVQHLTDYNLKQIKKEKRKNASLAIRRRYYKKIIPTSLTALQTVPLPFAPILVLKLLLQFLLSVLVIAPIKTIQSIFK
ncbi:glycosyltransferase [Acinetobacter sp. ANC 3813]|uniref:glycosyltransferase n=1 Tax=Acinetobacter sp. ANC 3813 TaxID=1977873 RepID=UPI000A3490A2|nr:glycosyltransferase [Acinetobacter sp. ANC 3813]OTG89299.1 glycosyl transferase [Acinetobacter sp. ANC 3813]